jgi:hypothetical protein
MYNIYNVLQRYQDIMFCIDNIELETLIHKSSQWRRTDKS